MEEEVTIVVDAVKEAIVAAEPIGQEIIEQAGTWYWWSGCSSLLLAALCFIVSVVLWFLTVRFYKMFEKILDEEGPDAGCPVGIGSILLLCGSLIAAIAAICNIVDAMWSFVASQSPLFHVTKELAGI